MGRMIGIDLGTVFKIRADRLTEQELSDLHAATEQLKASSAGAVRIMENEAGERHQK